MKKILLFGFLTATALLAYEKVRGEAYPVEGTYNIGESSYVTVQDRDGPGKDFLASRKIPKETVKKVLSGFECYAIVDNNISILVTCKERK